MPPPPPSSATQRPKPSIDPSSADRRTGLQVSGVGIIFLLFLLSLVCRRCGASSFRPSGVSFLTPNASVQCRRLPRPTPRQKLVRSASLFPFIFTHYQVALYFSLLPCTGYREHTVTYSSECKYELWHLCWAGLFVCTHSLSRANDRAFIFITTAPIEKKNNTTHFSSLLYVFIQSPSRGLSSIHQVNNKNLNKNLNLQCHPKVSIQNSSRYIDLGTFFLLRFDLINNLTAGINCLQFVSY